MKNLYFTQGTTGEQGLVQDLVDEQIKMYGLECYYIPRQIHEDKLWNDIYYSQFKDSYLIEMYLENFEQFGGNGDMLSKFGLRVTDEIQLTVSRRRWQDFVESSTNKIVSGRPNDGDLIWFPLNETVFEIKYVENQKPFYQLGSLYTYTMTCEVFEYGDSIFDTGIPAVDNTEMESGVYPCFLALVVLDIGFKTKELMEQDSMQLQLLLVAVNGVLGPITITNAGGRYETAPVARWFSPTNGLIGTSTTEITNGVVSTVNSPTTPYVYGDITYDEIGHVQSVAGWAPTIVIDESPANVVGKVAEWNEDTRTLSVAYANGTFDVNELSCGYDSGARWSVGSSFDTLDMTDSFSENRQLEDEADDILDFTERNPFGEFGNFTGGF